MLKRYKSSFFISCHRDLISNGTQTPLRLSQYLVTDGVSAGIIEKGCGCYHGGLLQIFAEEDAASADKHSRIGTQIHLKLPKLIQNIFGIDFIPEANYIPGERVALLYITLFNEDSDADGVMLTDFQLRGVDTIIYMDWDLLTAANPVLGENYGMKLSPGTQCSIVLPHKLEKDFLGSWTWNHFGDYKLYFRVTVHPTEKIIEVH